MKRIVSAAAAICLLLTVLLLTSCGELLQNLISDLESSIENETSESSVRQTEATSPIDTETATDGPDSIPYKSEPSVSKYKMPEEEFTDPVEKEASEIIDGAISRALGCLETMKDDRHSSVTYSYDPDADGYLSSLTKEQREMYEMLVAAAKSGENFRITADEFSGDLRAAYFAMNIPLTYCEPGVASYFYISATSYLGMDDELHYRDVYGVYYDPYRDKGDTVGSGYAALEDVLHGADLLDHIVKRIVRFMPDGLSAYDRYYYLAAVLSERTKYSGSVPNSDTAFGALVGGNAVCEGYSMAYTLLCREAGLWCAYRTSESHMWNMIMLESGIYNVDVTWCDSADTPYQKEWYRYFVKSDAYFAENGHSPVGGVPSTGVFEPCPYEGSE